jgi:4-amino-4-deoxy-L-arabinose transferase-like glycosyltransferase
LPLLPVVNTFGMMSSPLPFEHAGSDVARDSVRALRERALTVVAGVTIAVHAVLAWLVRVPTIGTGNDDAVYLLLARALRQGHYRELFYAGTPIHSQYPPGYPSLLALLGAPLDGEVGIVIAANILLSCAALVLLYDVVRRWSPALATLAVAVLALNPALVVSASEVQSEPMFMAAVMLAVWALRPSATPGQRWIAIAAVIVASLTRSAGLVIIAAAFAHFVLARAWRHAAVLAVAACLTIVPWLAWTMVAPQQVAGRSYIADAMLPMPVRDSTGARVAPAEVERRSRLATLTRTMRIRVTYNARRYITRALPARLAVPTVPNTPVDNVAWLVVMLIATGAGVAAAWSRWRAAVLALTAYALLLVIWPYAIGRFLVPLLPVLVAFLLLGAWRIGVRLVPRAPLGPALVLAAVLLLGGSRSVAALVRDDDACASAEEDEREMCADALSRYREVAQRIDGQLNGDAPVFTTKEGTFFYHTGRQVVSVYPALGLPADSLAGYLRARNVAMIFLPHLRSDEVELGEPLAELCASLTDAGSAAEEQLILFVRPPDADEQNACTAIARWRATWERGG